ncbi:MAG: hypothetical protein AVDCRST_MAG28-3471 [uncultured Rubrobacteraceae bacterium]|uniref:Uncharacterized protein n=1 Tax=uncultured Rubrobacteraceae bacterium TaxID=349277 RepID=A0A6J4R8M8_9ACTN|nr:MAG: hypothetical protein AVDCRST_MAG28-3471 [uncultured Rubrobacteraceae bacterium]
MGTHEGEVRSIIASTVGGVMTKDVGAITGDLEVATCPTKSEGLQVAVRYAGAYEWYTVEGGPIELGKAGGLTPLVPYEFHERIASHLTAPGRIVDGNEEPVSLRGFSL